ncbi:MAG TPA: hypothetical protein VFI20_05225 [Terracidiphilus sp.]|nr:hypothetical protein [Terracidiphilus sp.]
MTIAGESEMMDETAIGRGGVISGVLRVSWFRALYSLIRNTNFTASNVDLMHDNLGVAGTQTRKAKFPHRLALLATGLFLLAAVASCLPLFHRDFLSAFPYQLTAHVALAGSIVFKPSVWLRSITRRLRSIDQLELVGRESGLDCGLDRRDEDAEITVRLNRRPVGLLRKPSGVVTICHPKTGASGAGKSLRRGTGRVDSYTSRNDHALPFWVK